MKPSIVSALSIAMVALVCSCASKPTLNSIKPRISEIRRFADSLKGLSVDEVRAKLGDARISETEWKASGYGGRELDATFPSHVIRVMFSEDKVVYASVE